VLDARPAHRHHPAGFSRLHGVAVFELRLPPPTAVTLIVRDGTTLVPDRDTVLRAGDELLLITTPNTREATERRMRAIDRCGKLARWLGEHGAPEREPSTPEWTE
jgi:cell volume regulation protein A